MIRPLALALLSLCVAGGAAAQDDSPPLRPEPTVLRFRLKPFTSAVPELGAETVSERTARGLESLGGQATVVASGGDLELDCEVVRVENRVRVAYTLTTVRAPKETRSIGFDYQQPRIGPLAARVMAEGLLKAARGLESQRKALGQKVLEAPLIELPVRTSEDAPPGTLPAGAPATPDRQLLTVTVGGFVDAYFSQFYRVAPSVTQGSREIQAQVDVRARALGHAEALVGLNFRYDPGAPYRNRISLWEARVDVFFGDYVTLSVGRQLLSWGTFFAAGDKINPRDISDHLRTERLPIFAVDLAGNFGPLKVELLAVPEVSASFWPEVSDLDFATDGVLIRNPWLPAMATALQDGTPVRNVYSQAERPPFRLDNIQAGIRLAYRGERLGFSAHYWRGFDTFPLRRQGEGPDPQVSGGVLRFRTFDFQRLQVFALEADCKCGPVRPFIGAGFFRTASFDDVDPTVSIVSEPSWLAGVVGLELRLDRVASWLDVKLKAQFRAELQVLLYPSLRLVFAPPNVYGQPPGLLLFGHFLNVGPDFQLDILLFGRARLGASGLLTVINGGLGNWFSFYVGYEPLPGVVLTLGSDFIGGPPASRLAREPQTGRFFLRARYELR